jgi:hypothetical protein
MNPDPPGESPNDGTGPLSEPGAHAPPADLDYEAIRLIGRGGYGDVWLVRDRAGGYFACKVVYRESFRNDRPYEREYEGIQKFEPVSQSNESQVKILHVGRRDEAGYFYYIMELADDVASSAPIDAASYVPRTLRSEIERRKKLPVSECLQIGLSLTAALENLHRHGLIHRDIKPANIIFVQGVPKLADIGLVTDMDVTVSYVGTEGFIPPEGPKSPQADVYGLGKVLYEIATGKDRLEFPELPENFSELPDWETLLELNAIIIKACETDPRNRYASAKEFHDDLALLSTGKSVRHARASRRRTKWMVRSCLIAAAAGVIVAGIFYARKYWHMQTPAGSARGVASKIPWPAAHDVAENEASLKETYKLEIAAGTGSARQQAAMELFKRSATAADPAFQAASLRVAGLLAAEADDLSLAMDICEAVGQRFEINIFPLKVELLTEAGSHARTPRTKSDLLEVCLATSFAALAADDYPSATALADLSKTTAEGSGSPLTAEADFLSEETARCGQAFDRISNDWKIFRERPNDPQASLAVGKFLCFEKNDWAAGLPLMARGNDDALKAAVNLEIHSKLLDPQDQLALGNSWWDLSVAAQDDNKILYQRRARYWYLKSIASSRELEKKPLRERLAERIAAVTTEAGAVHIVSRVGGAEFVDIYSDEVQWKSSPRGTSGNKINHVSLGDFKAGGLGIIKNSGATRLMPDAVDFSTAHLAIDRNPRRQGGQATLQIADDHVRVILAHPRMGASEIEVTVSFDRRP